MARRLLRCPHLLGKLGQPDAGLNEGERRALGSAAHVSALDGSQQQAGERLPARGVGEIEMAGDQRHPVGEAGGQQGLQRRHLVVEVETDGADGAALREVALLDPPGEGVEERAHLGPRLRPLGQSLINERHHPPGIDGERFGSDLQLALREEMVDRSLRRTTGADDLVDAGATEPGTAHQPDRGLEHAFATAGLRPVFLRHQLSLLDFSYRPVYIF